MRNSSSTREESIKITEEVRIGYRFAMFFVLAGGGRSTLKKVSLELKSLRVTCDILNYLMLCVGEERRMAGSQMRKAISTPTI